MSQRMEHDTKDYGHLHEMAVSHVAAERIVPEILAITGPVRSVVDVGGGDGGWLRAFQAHGVEEVSLIDCPEVAAHLVIDDKCFQPCNLRHNLPAPRRHDLAICLECAEHLPAHRAKPLVEWLTKAADVVVFSAAIPGQAGHGHVHLRFPDYWKQLFSEHGFRCHDVLRPRILGDMEVPWWYRQNMFMFVSPAATVRAEGREGIPDDFYLVHKSTVFVGRSVKTLICELGPALVSAIRRRILPRST